MRRVIAAAARGRARRTGRTRANSYSAVGGDDPTHAWNAAMTDFGNAAQTEYVYPGHCTVAGTPCAVSPVAAGDAKAGFAELVIAAHKIDMYTPAQP